MMGIKEIQEIIPHRHPFLLIDCIEEVTPGEGAVGYKNVTYNEPWFAGHFPQEPVMPGVLIVEALAQTGAVAILEKCQRTAGETGVDVILDDGFLVLDGNIFLILLIIHGNTDVTRYVKGFCHGDVPPSLFH